MAEAQAKILIIDDDPAIGEMLKTLLEFNNYVVTVSDKPLRTRENILKLKPDIVIMDVRLSGVDGTEVCAELKKDPAIRDVPILMMSALTGADITCRQAGADGFIAKPFEMDELLKTLQKVISVKK